MSVVKISASRDYEAHIGHGLLDDCGRLLRGVTKSGRAAVISDDIVDALYGDRLRASLSAAGFSVCSFAFPNGEGSKNMRTFSDILEFLAQEQMTRGDVIVALGGGVVGDTAGFAAACYLRGLDYVQVPTTFLAAADSSTGGKTAVNLAAGKNLAGAFHLPRLVVCDCDTFETLPPQVFADGTAETLKHGLIADADFFRRLALGGWQADMESVVRRDVEIKSSFVLADEHDHGLRQQLNFGHTIGHAIERCSAYSVSHGHAVAAGMVLAARGAFRLGLSSCDCAGEIAAALSANGLPTGCSFGAEELCRVALSDKKRSGDSINIVCLESIGKAKLVPLPSGRLFEFIAAGLEE